MKKINVIQLIILAIALVSVMSGCKNPSGGGKNVTYIDVTGFQSEFELYVEDFSLAWVLVTVNYSDGSLETFAETDFAAAGVTVDSGAYNMYAAGPYPIKLKYKGVEVTFTVKVIDPAVTVFMPKASPEGGGYPGTVSVTLGCKTSGVQIRYTTNGDEPTAASTLYSTPIAINPTATLKAIAFKGGLTTSGIMTEVYLFQPSTISVSASGFRSFGSLQTPYTQPGNYYFTITNTGNSDVTLTQPTAVNYDIGTLTAVTIAANGGSATFTIRPKANLSAGVYNETIAIDGTGGASAEANVSFTVTPEGAKIVMLGPQEGVLRAGEAGTATFSIATSGIAAGAAGSVTFYSDAAGTLTYYMPGGSGKISTVVSPVSGDAVLVTFTAVNSVTQGSGYFRVMIDGAQSNVETLTIDAGGTITIGAQSGALSAGATGTVTFPFATTGIAGGGTIELKWYGPDGVTPVSAPSGISSPIPINSGNPGTGTVTINGSAGTVGGSYYFRVEEFYGDPKSEIAVLTIGAPPTIAVTSGGLTGLKVGKLVSSAYIVYTLANGTYAASITPANFTVSYLPPGLTAGTAVRTSDTVVTQPITGTPTDYNSLARKATLPVILPAANVTSAAAPVAVTGTVTASAVARGDGAAVSVPTVNGTPTATSITVNAVVLTPGTTGQAAQYAVNQSSTTVPSSGWQTSTTFSGLSPATAYYVWARSALSTNYAAGTAQHSTAITTGSSDGSASAPFLVATLADLQRVGTGTVGPGGIWSLASHYKQTANITFSGAWTPIGTDANRFTGSYDGGNFTIGTLTISNSASYQGLFGAVGTGGVVKNLKMTISISASSYIGGVAGFNQGTIDTCSVAGTITSPLDKGANIGGVAGFNGGTVKNCTATVNVSGGERVGGVVGLNQNGIVENCSASGNVKGNMPVANSDFSRRIGGIVGENYGSGIVRYCRASGDISGYADSIGGVVGSNDNLVEDCYYNGNNIEGIYISSVFSGSNVGGVVGSNHGTVRRCYATGAITGGSNYAGGVVGSNNDGKVQNCVSLVTSVKLTNSTSAVRLRRVSGDNINDELTNNYARSSGMTLNYVLNGTSTINTYTPTPGAGVRDGANVASGTSTGTTPPGYNTSNFWGTTLSWNLSTIWQMTTGGSNLPTLRGLP